MKKLTAELPPEPQVVATKLTELRSRLTASAETDFMLSADALRREALLECVPLLQPAEPLTVCGSVPAPRLAQCWALGAELGVGLAYSRKRVGRSWVGLDRAHLNEPSDPGGYDFWAYIDLGEAGLHVPAIEAFVHALPRKTAPTTSRRETVDGRPCQQIRASFDDVAAARQLDLAVHDTLKPEHLFFGWSVSQEALLSATDAKLLSICMPSVDSIWRQDFGVLPTTFEIGRLGWHPGNLRAGRLATAVHTLLRGGFRNPLIRLSNVHFTTPGLATSPAAWRFQSVRCWLEPRRTRIACLVNPDVGKEALRELEREFGDIFGASNTAAAAGAVKRGASAARRRRSR